MARRAKICRAARHFNVTQHTADAWPSLAAVGGERASHVRLYEVVVQYAFLVSATGMQGGFPAVSIARPPLLGDCQGFRVARSRERERASPYYYASLPAVSHACVPLAEEADTYT